MFAGWTKNVNTAFRGFVQKYLLNGLRTEDGWTILSGILASPSGTILTAYEQNVFVYACIKVIAENISSVPILLEDIISSENKTELVSGQVYDLMLRPNIYQIDTDFINSVVSWWQYRGEAFIILERQQGASMFDVPDAMWTVDPQTVVPVMETDKNGRQRIIGWNTYAGAETIFVTFSNMILL